VQGTKQVTEKKVDVPVVPAGASAGNKKNVWMITREYDGLAGAGGVKDVCRQLAEALVSDQSCRVRVVLPGYGFIHPQEAGFQQLFFGSGRTHFSVDMDYPEKERREEVSVWQQTMRGVDVFVLESSRFAEKSGVYTYTEKDEKEESWQRRGRGHYDYFAMNILLQKAALDLMILLDHRPDIIHCHDGHAATLPAMMRELPGYRHFFSDTGSVVTIHNAGSGYHQEIADLAFARAVTGLPGSVIDASLLNGCFDPFLSAANYARLNTVSDNYARELQQTGEDIRTGWLGHKLLRRGVRLAGITNGINPDDFNPENPEKLGLDASFSPRRGELSGKLICKKKMLKRCRQKSEWANVIQHGQLDPTPEFALFTFIGRLTTQKGVDLLLQALSLLLAREKETFQLLVLGSGDPDLERQLEILAVSDELSGRFCFLKGYDSDLANKVYAAGDFFLIPSLYEPCGLTDYMAQLMGSLPIVHHVGGLVKVLHEKTGFAYKEQLPDELASTMQQALQIYSNEPARIRTMQREAVLQIYKYHSWPKVTKDYLMLYQQASAMTAQEQHER